MKILYLIRWFLSVVGVALVGTRTCAQPRKLHLQSNLQEISGLARTPDGKYWALNDGGNTAVIYQLDPQSGQIIKSLSPPIPNVDWEELSADAQGRLWVGDFGNNRNQRRDLRCYRFHPDRPEQVDTLSFYYPDQTQFPPGTEAERQFDAEAMVWRNDSLHIFTKSRFKGRHYAKRYVLPARPGHYPALLKDSVYLPQKAVTGAALSPDGQTLALTAYYVRFRRFWLPYTRAHVYFFHLGTQGEFFTGPTQRKRLPKVLFARQFESIAWYAPGVWWAANEGFKWQKPCLWRIKH